MHSKKAQSQMTKRHIGLSEFESLFQEAINEIYSELKIQAGRSTSSQPHDEKKASDLLINLRHHLNDDIRKMDDAHHSSPLSEKQFRENSCFIQIDESSEEKSSLGVPVKLYFVFRHTRVSVQSPTKMNLQTIIMYQTSNWKEWSKALQKEVTQEFTLNEVVKEIQSCIKREFSKKLDLIQQRDVEFQHIFVRIFINSSLINAGLIGKTQIMPSSDSQNHSQDSQVSKIKMIKPQIDQHQNAGEVSQCDNTTSQLPLQYQFYLSILNGRIRHFCDNWKTERPEIPQSSILFTPLPQYKALITGEVINMFQNMSSQKFQPKILFISLTMDHGNKIVKDLEEIAKKDQHKRNMIYNQCQKNKKFLTKNAFQEETKNFNIIVGTGKQIYTLTWRGILKVQDYNLIIIQDLNPKNDSSHLYFIERFYARIKSENRGLLISFFDERPYNCSSDKALQMWMEDKVKQTQSSFIGMQSSQVELIEAHPTDIDLKILDSVKGQLTSLKSILVIIEFDPNDNKYSELFNEDEVKQQEIPEKENFSLSNFISKYIQHPALLQKPKDHLKKDSEYKKIESDKKEILSCGLGFVPTASEINAFIITLKKLRLIRSEDDIIKLNQDILHNSFGKVFFLSFSNEISSLRGLAEINLLTSQLRDKQEDTFKIFVASSNQHTQVFLDTFQFLPKNQDEIIKKSYEKSINMGLSDEEIQLGEAIIHQRDAPALLIEQLEKLITLVDYQQDQDVEQDELDQLRKPKKQYVECRDIGKAPKKYYPKILLMPPCLKKLNIDFDESDLREMNLLQKYFSNKKDAEDFITLYAIKKMYDKGGILDDFMNVIMEPEIIRLEDFPNSFKVDNGYIQRPLVKDAEIYITVVEPSHNYPFRDTSYRLGILIDRSLSHLNLSYGIQINFQAIQQHSEYLKLANKDKSLLQEHQELSYHMNTQFQLPYSSLEEKSLLLEKLKFFHIYQYYQMSGIEHAFMRKLYKWGFSFAEVLFGNQIILAWERHREFLTQMFKGNDHTQRIKELTEKELNHYMYVVPIVKKSGEKNYAINLKLIEATISHIRMQLILSLDYSFETSPSQIDRLDQEKIQSHLWTQMTGSNKIIDVVRADEKEWNKVSLTHVPKQKKKEFFEKNQHLTFPQFFLIEQGVLLQKKNSRNFFEFSKYQNFFDCVALKNFQPINNLKNFIDGKRYLKKGHLTPSQTITVNPIPYEYFCLMQHSCSHLMKLCDFLRTESFIYNKFIYPQSMMLKKVQEKLKISIDEDLQWMKQLEMNVQNNRFLKNSSYNGIEIQQPFSVEELRQSLYQNLPLINASLTNSSSQMQANSERLESYGESLMTFLVILELYLTRQIKIMQDDLDNARTIRTSNDVLTLVNLNNDIYEHMIVEPQTQQQICTNLELTESSSSQNVIKVMTPGGLCGNKFSNKVKNIKYQSIKQKQWLLMQILYRFFDDKKSPIDNIEQKYCYLLEIILKKKNFRDKFKNEYPEHYEIAKKIIRERPGPEVIKRIATQFSNQSQQHQLSFGKLYSFFLSPLIKKLENQKTYAKPIIKQKEQQQQQEGKSSTFDENEINMTLKIQKDKKLADTIRALVAAVSMVGGIPSAYSYLRSMGIVNTELRQLNDRVQQILEQKDQEAELQIKQNRMKDVEDIIGYTFNNKMLLLQAFTHKTYSDQIYAKKRIRLLDYNILEFLGDSLINFLVTEFFYNHSQAYSDDYGHDILHKLKTEITSNNFFGLIMVETKLCEKILKVEKIEFNQKFDDYIQLVRKCLDRTDVNSGRSSKTQDIFNDFFINNHNALDEFSEINLKKDFMRPDIMERMAELTAQRRVNLEEPEQFKMKIFGDVLEALFGAIFIDTGCDISITRKVFMKMFKPYLYVYGNTNTTMEHPRTETKNLWSRQSVSNIKDHKMQITHLTVSDASRQYITYKGSIDNVEVVSACFGVQEKNKLRIFYDKFKQFLEGFIPALYQKIPNLDSEVKRLSSQTQDHSESILTKVEYSSEQTPQYKSSTELYEEVRNFTKQYLNNPQLPLQQKESLTHGLI